MVDFTALAGKILNVLDVSYDARKGGAKKEGGGEEGA